MPEREFAAAICQAQSAAAAQTRNATNRSSAPLGTQGLSPDKTLKKEDDDCGYNGERKLKKLCRTAHGIQEV